jgi:hypothetical protein
MLTMPEARQRDARRPNAPPRSGGDLTSLQRQLDDSFVVNHVANAGALDVHERRGRRGRYSVLEAADGQHDVDDRRRRDLDDDACLLKGAELRESGFEAVGPVGRFGRT